MFCYHAATVVQFSRQVSPPYQHRAGVLERETYPRFHVRLESFQAIVSFVAYGLSVFPPDTNVSRFGAASMLPIH